MNLMFFNIASESNVYFWINNAAMMKLIFVTLLISLTFLSYSQDTVQSKRNVVQFTGILVEGDSLQPLPFTHIIVKNSNIGTISDYFGFFSFVARTSDTIIFSSMGYHRSMFVIPDTLTENSYSIIHVMHKDTVILKEVTIYPWPTREQFKQAFMALKVPDNGTERARKHLERDKLIALSANLPTDGSLSYKYEQQNRNTRLYQSAGYPSISLLNPIAWAKFIEAWKKGDFKKQGVNYLPK